MWLDGLYGRPFYAEYADLMHETADFDDIANQFIWVEKHTAIQRPGCSTMPGTKAGSNNGATNKPALGSFLVACHGLVCRRAGGCAGLVSPDHPKRKSLIDILNRLVTALEKFQDPKTGVWLDILNYDGPARAKLFRGIGQLPVCIRHCRGVRERLSAPRPKWHGPERIRRYPQTVYQRKNGQTNLYYTVKGSGLRGNPYRDGTFNYYMSEPLVVNEPKGRRYASARQHRNGKGADDVDCRGKTVLLDRYFNSEKRKKTRVAA